MSKTVHVKVLRSHPDFALHPGEVSEISAEKFDEYAEKGAFFRKATPEEVKNAAGALETATVPLAPETAAVPAALPKTAPAAPKTPVKTPEKAEKAEKKAE